MFALTVDQVGSRRTADLVHEIEADRARFTSAGALLGPDRTAGDEFQLLFSTADAALATALDLSRRGAWTVGIGVGEVDRPLPPTVREAAGTALVAARRAVDEAKASPLRVAVAAEHDPAAAADVGALVRLLIELRQRRSPEGWEVADLLEAAGTQAAVAVRLGITAQAVSLRARAAGLRTEQEALPAIARRLAALDRAVPASP